MYLAPACTFWLLIGSLALERQAMVANDALAVVLQRPGAFAAAATMGFAVNLLSYFVIKAGLCSSSRKGCCPWDGMFVVWMPIA